MRSMKAHENGSASSKFLFIPVDGLQSRKVDNAKPESQKYLTAARKHVMYEIGLSRRRVKKKRAPDSHDKLQLQPQAKSCELQDLQEPQRGQSNCLITPNTWAFDPEEDYRCETAAVPLQSSPMSQVREILGDQLHRMQQPALGSSRLDPFIKWPVNFTNRMQYLIDHLLSTDCKSIRAFRVASWPLLNLDHGIFYHSLAVSALCLSTRYPKPKKHELVSEGLFYYSKGLKSVNRRLGSDLKGEVDGIVASIMGIAIHSLTGCASNGWCWETAQSSPQRHESGADQWMLHFNALKTILDQRGSVETIGKNRVLRYWLYIMDVEGTATRDTQPFFPLPRYIHPITESIGWSPSPTVQACLSSWTQEFPALSTVIQIFADLDCVISWISHQLALQNGMFWAQIEVDPSWLLPLVHRCLQLSGRSQSRLDFEHRLSNSDPCDEFFQDALRHAIMLFIAPIRRCFGPPASGTDIHVTKLTSALHVCLLHPAAANLQNLVLWMLVVGALEACRLEQDASWFFSRIVDTCALTGAKEFDEVKQTLRHVMVQMIWLEEVMDSAFALMMKSLRIFMEWKPPIELNGEVKEEFDVAVCGDVQGMLD